MCVCVGTKSCFLSGRLQFSHSREEKGGSLSFKFNLVDPEGNKLIDQSFFISVLGMLFLLHLYLYVHRPSIIGLLSSNHLVSIHPSFCLSISSHLFLHMNVLISLFYRSMHSLSSAFGYNLRLPCGQSFSRSTEVLAIYYISGASFPSLSSLVSSFSSLLLCLLASPLLVPPLLSPPPSWRCPSKWYCWVF